MALADTVSKPLSEAGKFAGKHPYILAAGGAVVLLLFLGARKTTPVSAGGMSEALQSKLIDADIQSQQIQAGALVANMQTNAGLQSAIANARAGISLAGIQATSDQFAAMQSTVQNRESLQTGERVNDANAANRISLANIESGSMLDLAKVAATNRLDLAGVESNLQTTLASKDGELARYLANLEDQYKRWELPQTYSYQRSQDDYAFKIAKVTAPYTMSQNNYLMKRGYSPVFGSYGFGDSFGASAGNSLGSSIGPIIQGLASAAASYFGGGGGGMSNTAAANAGMDAMASSSAGSFGGLFG